ncbi:N-acetylglucosaminyldiphosphodolichol N-acetylglucosaminyltransferase [Malassezia japonica]|uniref:UDP-N-acetylglucosamine transferase subunit ALG14 n=1 Tax=Malassezia japonica TaxID=223818 RepID=A0AAF0F0Y7_9BASI|nr:N-acetylglucosaminyldiphosphodolichol N-acetylglucosaminyltransferase [Malassezia japonica]WFD40758.1 N-acetylglucosaminyldiphosphodolichol N-acetylglucosaminyltransferase [Malassezia japonica]
MVSSGDTFSLAKAQAFEEARRGSPKLAAHPLQALEIPRARSVGQSWLTTPFTLAWSFLFCILHIGIAPLVSYWTHATPLPVVDVVLMNGPATCVPVVLVAHMLRFFSLPSPRLVYIESFARVRSLSLSAKILRKIVDQFVVQWPSADPKAICYGVLV